VLLKLARKWLKLEMHQSEREAAAAVSAVSVGSFPLSAFASKHHGEEARRKQVRQPSSVSPYLVGTPYRLL
jgi:hypothetical protein